MFLDISLAVEISLFLKFIDPAFVSIEFSKILMECDPLVSEIILFFSFYNIGPLRGTFVCSVTDFVFESA